MPLHRQIGRLTAFIATEDYEKAQAAAWVLLFDLQSLNMNDRLKGTQMGINRSGVDEWLSVPQTRVERAAYSAPVLTVLGRQPTPSPQFAAPGEALATRATDVQAGGQA